MKNITENIKKAYFIGIGGIGISALAQMLASLGIEVSGVNDDPSPETLGVLKNKGIEVILKEEYSTLPESDIYIYSDAWHFRGPEIIQEAKDTGKPVLSFFEALGEFSKKYKVIAISGTHGKTTTSAMVAKIMIDAGLDPTAIVGSVVKDWESNFRAGDSDYLVVEADEYNRHMLYFRPFIGAVTNIEADHLDVYKDLADIKQAFDQFLNQSEHKIKDYSQYISKVPELKVPGGHNRQNAALALSVAESLGISFEVAKRSLSNFEGTWRRLENRGITKEGVIVYDDYAHHPTEIKASLQALVQLYPNKKITIVFQPHMYSRTKAFFAEFIDELSKAKELMLLPVFYAREEKDESVSVERMAQEINKKGGNARAFSGFKEAKDYIKTKEWSENDVFVTMGAGEAYKVADHCFDF